MISVIMPVYKESIYELRNSINSILNQTYTNFEFIIVDDNPNSINIKKFLIKKSKQDKRIKLIFNNINKGSMASADEAIKLSKGYYIARMDADDISCKNRLKEQLKFSVHYNLDISTCDVYPIINNHIIVNNNYSITEIDQNKLKYLLSHMTVINDIIGGPTLFFNRHCVKSIGGYRNMIGEDCDLVLRMIIHGFKAGYLSEVLVYKRYREDSLSNSSSLKVFVIMNMLTKCVRKYKYKYILPLSYIHKRINSITTRNYYLYLKFMEKSQLFKQNKTLVNWLQKCYWGCSSILIFRRNVYMLRFKLIHKIIAAFTVIKKLYKRY